MAPSPTVPSLRRVMLRAKSKARALSSEVHARTTTPVVALDDVRRRLELFLAALYGRSMPIEAVDAPTVAGFFRRHVLHLPDAQAASDAMPTTDGERIFLPRALNAAKGRDRALMRFRLLALEQAERIARGTAAHYPAREIPLVRDLYLMSEGIAVDASIARTMLSVRGELSATRANALARRPHLFHLMPAERELELLLRAGLADAPADAPAPSPVESLAWAQATAERIGRRRYYGAARPVHHWGALLPGAGADGRTPVVDAVALRLQPPTVPVPGRRSTGGSGEGMSAPRAFTTGAGTPPGAPSDSGPQGQVWVPDMSDAAGQQTAPGTRTPAADAASRPAPPRGAIAEIDPFAPASDDGRRQMAAAVAGSEFVTQYPEWDNVTETYRERAVTVHAAEPVLGNSDWATDVFRDHAVLVRQVRQRFERLRALRTRSGRQLDGDELDIPACVRAAVDRHMGHAPDDRLYMTARAARHPMAIMLLADVSGSTKAVVSEPMRMIDIEKIALLVASEALSSMGDRFALLAFAGRGPHGVRVTTLKDFHEGVGDAVRQRIAGLEPAGFTRLGAAVRHATAALRREPARHRLLLVLSDGRPNDADEYMADYGVDDSRQSMAEARAQGVYPFCLNVDDEGSEYLPRIFGAAGYTSLRRPDQLPVALLQVVRTLITS